MRSKAVMLDEFAKTYLAAGKSRRGGEERGGEPSRSCVASPRPEKADKDAIRANLAVSLIRIGDVKRAQGDRKAALAAYEETLALDRKRAEADKDDAHAQQDVATDLDRIADIKLDAGDARARSQPYEESFAIRRDLAKAEPKMTELQRAISVSLGKISDVQRDAGDGGSARLHQESLAIARQLLRAIRQYRVAARHRHRARAARRPQAQRRRRGGALAAHEKGLAIRRQLASSMRVTRSGIATSPSVSARSAT